MGLLTRMRWRKLAARLVIGAVALFLALGAVWIAALPAPRDSHAIAPIARDEVDATLRALQPPKRQRPLIAIAGINDSTETTDYVMPYGILRRSGVADVLALATQPGPMILHPALQVEADATLAEFDARYPEGADYVIVPKMSRDDDPLMLTWLRGQANKGALILGVCVGAKVVAAAGLLEGKRGTTHWFYVDELLDEHPSIRYVADRRFVVDQGVATTTGITASMPFSLTLIEAIAGREKAAAVARELGVAHWDARHDSAAFELTRPFALTVLRNVLAFWNREQLGLELEPGVDEVSLALVADAWSRTYRSHAVTFARSGGAQPSKSGLRILPDRVAPSWPRERLLPPFVGQPAALALDAALGGIESRYGSSVEAVVAMQLEYPQHVAPGAHPEETRSTAARSP